MNIISEKFAELGELLQQYMTQEAQAPRPVTVADMSEIETMVPEYLDPGVKLLKVPTIYRFNQSGLRYYFSIDDEQVTFFPSVTTILKETLPTSPGLQELRDRLGKEGYYAFMNERADYGTLLHVFAADYQRHNRNFDTDTISKRIAEYSEEHNLRFDTHNWSYYLNKDLRAIAQFIHDYDVKPIAIELIGKYTGKLQTVLVDNKTELDVCFSGAIDLLCEMTIEEKGFYGEILKNGPRKGEPKETKQSRRVTAIVDFKSGKNGFHPEHEMQLHMYKMMVEQSFGIKVDKLFNVSPKDWETVPNYNIKDQTDSQHAGRIPFLLGSYFCIYPGVRDILIMSGKLNGGNMSECTKWVPAQEWVLGKLGIKPEQKSPQDELHVLAERIKKQPVKITASEAV